MGNLMEKTCKFYKELDRILGHRPASVPSCWTQVILPAPWLNLKRVKKKQMVKIMHFTKEWHTFT